MNFSHPPSEIPSGTILPFFDSIVNIPQKWVVCDGNNGTDNLTNKYILSISSTTDTVGDVGGSNNITLAEGNLPSHSHSGTTSVDGVHKHTFKRSAQYEDTTKNNDYYETTDDYATNTSANGSHSHGNITLNSSGQPTPTDVNNEPPYHETIFIQKI